MRRAAKNGDIEIVKFCKEQGVIDYNGAMFYAALWGYVEIVKLCREWCGIDYNAAIYYAALGGSCGDRKIM